MLEKSYHFNPLKWPKTSIIGLAGIITYCIFTLLSFFLFPGNFNPIYNNISELGDFYDNPNGAIFYNVGMVLTGLISILFYIGLYKWFMIRKKSNLNVTALVAGILNALAIIMSGIFSETKETYSQHVFWSILIFVSFFSVLILVNASVLTRPDFTNLVAYYGFGVSLIDLFFLVFLIITGVNANYSLMEWLAVFSYISWICILAISLLQSGVLVTNSKE
ncbi:MAG: DUF998 domain-containing protein [Candidatus Thorarchaeota archaeon]